MNIYIFLVLSNRLNSGKERTNKKFGRNRRENADERGRRKNVRYEREEREILIQVILNLDLNFHKTFLQQLFIFSLPNLWKGQILIPFSPSPVAFPFLFFCFLLKPCGLRMVVLFRPPLPFIVRIEDRLQFLFPSIVRKIDVWDQVL